MYCHAIYLIGMVYRYTMVMYDKFSSYGNSALSSIEICTWINLKEDGKQLLPMI